MMGALEVVFLLNKSAQLLIPLIERVDRGEMTKDEALAAWALNVADIKLEEARFDALTGGDAT
jgi:hypothetical protein